MKIPIHRPGRLVVINKHWKWMGFQQVFIHIIMMMLVQAHGLNRQTDRQLDMGSIL